MHSSNKTLLKVRLDFLCSCVSSNIIFNFCYSLLFFYFCFFVSDIEDLPPAVQEKLFDEVLDRDVQKGEMFSLSASWLSVAVTRTACYAYIFTLLLWEGERETRSKMTTMVWRLGKHREPPHKLYTITGRLPSTGSVILLVFSLLPMRCFACPLVTLSGGLSLSCAPVVSTLISLIEF